ncbi:hypothetical protein IV203_020700 [Nitzschia inconspicua]|uniref:Uncharacterized protein n=1 Tax=Nitzschia inconspicua TaxID=303405 RepID=A0A9K3K814_9STRA|nr:hypothetical protein IV203_021610 [Nitzschia inconspicua]KAG7342756.1 hypothetical protein IV203_020700 [Nitzschia inconspicua]
MPASSHEDSLSSLGNASLSTFLSTLLKDEEKNKFEVVVDNAKPDNNNSFCSLKLAEDTPKCRWHNLVRNDSDSDIRSTRRGGKLRSRRSNANRRSTSVRRTVSDPDLCLQMPRRIESPMPTTQTKSPGRMTIRSESDILRMPQRLQSPIADKTRNATWDTTRLNEQSDVVNMFIDMMIAAEDDATKPISPHPTTTCLTGEVTSDSDFTAPCLLRKPNLSPNEKGPSMPRHTLKKPRRSALTHELRKSLVNDLRREE